MKRSWSKWGKICPVELNDNGTLVEGSVPVECCNKLVLVSDSQNAQKMIINPSRYIFTDPRIPVKTVISVNINCKIDESMECWLNILKSIDIVSNIYNLKIINIKDILNNYWKEDMFTIDETEKILKGDNIDEKTLVGCVVTAMGLNFEDFEKDKVNENTDQELQEKLIVSNEKISEPTEGSILIGCFFEDLLSEMNIKIYKRIRISLTDETIDDKKWILPPSEDGPLGDVNVIPITANNTSDQIRTKIMQIIDPFYNDSVTFTEEKNDDETDKETFWGQYGPFCPVTLLDENWLFYSIKKTKLVYEDKIFGLANDYCKDIFLLSPEKYLKFDPILPPPRIVICGPLGSQHDIILNLLANHFNADLLDFQSAYFDIYNKKIYELKESIKRQFETKLVNDRVLKIANSDDDTETIASLNDEMKNEDNLANNTSDNITDVLLNNCTIRDETVKQLLHGDLNITFINGNYFPNLNEDVYETDDQIDISNLLLTNKRTPDIFIFIDCDDETAIRRLY
eukprot:GHVL01017289.1.p1 GENE.GHVL01017289.1~~GHVL01017289.1.p1  ORF type:complete len:513 (-),score=160.23 GHVL01017289.1:406-1944(-)